MTINRQKRTHRETLNGHKFHVYAQARRRWHDIVWSIHPDRFFQKTVRDCQHARIELQHRAIGDRGREVNRGGELRT